MGLAHAFAPSVCSTRTQYGWQPAGSAASRKVNLTSFPTPSGSRSKTTFISIPPASITTGASSISQSETVRFSTGVLKLRVVSVVRRVSELLHRRLRLLRISKTRYAQSPPRFLPPVYRRRNLPRGGSAPYLFQGYRPIARARFRARMRCPDHATRIWSSARSVVVGKVWICSKPLKISTRSMGAVPTTFTEISGGWLA